MGRAMKYLYASIMFLALLGIMLTGLVFVDMPLNPWKAGAFILILLACGYTAACKIKE